MKNEKGITLVSLIAYIILITLVVAGITNITSSFYVSVNEFDRESKSAVAFSKFSMYMLKDVKRYGAEILSSTANSVEIYCEEDDGTSAGRDIVYSIEKGAIYRTEGEKSKIKVCDGIDKGEIIADKENNTITINVVMGDYKKTTTYVLEGYSKDTGNAEII